MNRKSKIIQLCEAVSREMELPVGSLFLHEYAASESICINEQEYPLDSSKKTIWNKSFIILNMKDIQEQEIELIIKNDQFEAVPLPEQGILKDVRDAAARHILFAGDDAVLYNYMREHMKLGVLLYKSGCKFGCCSKYEECSAVKRCIHENKLYATGCAYRSNLEQGRNFYHE